MAKRRPAKRARKIIRLPYVKKLKRWGKMTIWLVDGAYVRKNIDEEFNNFGHHYTFSEIPLNEFWMDQETDPDEQKFYIHHLKIEFRLMANGTDEDMAREKANQSERKERIK